jgi:1-acyl-sn-glycerol-3-phosphate acyltransferase
MELRRSFVNIFLKTALNIICKIDAGEYVQALRKNHPLIVIFNHINFLEIPILVTQSYPLYVTGLAKAETWDNPFFSFLFNTYKAIPIHRDGAFTSSFKKMRETLDNGFSMCVAPEGTRSRNGVLQKAKAGIIYLALEANVPILPVAHHGGENIWNNIRRFKRTPICFKAGRPFRIKCDRMPGRELREIILGEMMGQMAWLLPENLRGAYSEQAKRECSHLEFLT